MAELCIVCLGDLRSSVAEDPPPGLPDPVQLHDQTLPGGTAAQPTEAVPTTTTSRIHDDDEAIAHLLPCKHDLHHGCLKPWVERANSCPICRATFNTVELSHVVGGPVVDSYVVQDKIQEAEFDPSMIFEEDALAQWVEPWEDEACILCGCADGEYNFMFCDGCDKAVHVFCAGFDDTPDVWYCENCLVDLENDLGLPGMASAMTRRTRRRFANTQRRRPRRNNQDAVWARVWQEVSRRLDLDLDFPFDEEPEDQRTEEQRREFVRWQRRFEEANRQGAANRLRDIANAQIRDTEVATAPPESQEEIRAWNAFEKARESQDAPVSVRRRKRKATASPASIGEPEQVEQPQQKRPRLRRPPRPHADNPDDVAESSTAAAQRNAEGPTFLSSLLREVEAKPTSASSPGASEQHGQFSPREMSPMLSPASSPYGSPRAPSPQRPLSPPLSSSLVPTSPPEHSATFSPFSPVVYSQASLDGSRFHRRGRRHHKAAPDDPSSGDENGPAGLRASSMSPSRLSYSAKEELQRMVKLALGSRYRDKQISKDQYTDINRDVSRKLYDLVGDASALSDQAEREKWQAVADDEVKKAVAVISAANAAAAADSDPAAATA